MQNFRFIGVLTWIWSALSGHIIIISYQKGLTNKLYSYALARKKTGLHAKFQVHRCFDMDLVLTNIRGKESGDEALLIVYIYFNQNTFTPSTSLSHHLLHSMTLSHPFCRILSIPLMCLLQLIYGIT